MTEKLGINDFILKCWDIDDTGWRFKLMSDMWCEVIADSDALGHFREVSDHAGDVEETLHRLLGKIQERKAKR